MGFTNISKLNNVPDPTNAQDVATKNYVDTNAPSPKVAYLTDQKTAGTNGGALVANTWTTHTLQTSTDPQSIIVSLTSNQFTLAAGTYEIRAQAVGLGTSNWNASRIYNVTDSSVALAGISSFNPGGAAADRYQVSGIITIAAQKAFAFQVIANSVRGDALDLGYGHDWTDGTPEVFAEVRIQKLA